MELELRPCGAASKVLALPELLESILVCLPPLELLVDQRTSRAWRYVIQESPEIQRKLFFRADCRLKGHFAGNKPGTRPLNNLMLRKVMAGMYPTMTLQLLNFNSKDEFETAKKAANLSVTMKEDEAASSKGLAALGFWAWSVNLSFPTDALVSAQADHPAIAYPQASWRRMFMSQPPATALHLTRSWQRSPQPVLTVEGGITMQHLIDGAQENSWDEVYVGSDRDWHFEGPIKYSSFERVEERKS